MKGTRIACAAAVLWTLGTAQAAADSSLDGSCSLSGALTTRKPLTVGIAKQSNDATWDASGTCTGALDGAAIASRRVSLHATKEGVFAIGCTITNTGPGRITGSLTFVNGIRDATRPFGYPVSDPSGDDRLDDGGNPLNPATLVDPSGDDVPDPDDQAVLFRSSAQESVLAGTGVWVLTGGDTQTPSGDGGLAVARNTYAAIAPGRCAGKGYRSVAFGSTVQVAETLAG